MGPKSNVLVLFLLYSVITLLVCMKVSGVEPSQDEEIEEAAEYQQENQGEGQVQGRGALEQKFLTGLSANDPFAPESSTSKGHQLTCTEAGVPCTPSCEYVDWWTEPERTITATPLEQFEDLTSPADCFHECQKAAPSCTAFSFNPTSGHCVLFSTFLYSDITKDPEVAEGFSLYLRLGPSPPPIIIGEWVLYGDRRPHWNPYKVVDMSPSNPAYAYVSTSWVTCLDYCANTEDGGDPNPDSGFPPCLAAVFDLSTKSCSLYDEFDNTIAVVQPSLVALIHISTVQNYARDYQIFPSYRFTRHDHTYPEGQRAVTTRLLDSVEECLEICEDARWNCAVASIRPTKDQTDGDTIVDLLQCDIYRDVPKKFQYDPNSFVRSYILSVPPLNSRMQKLPSYAHVKGEAIAVYPVEDLNECWMKAPSHLVTPDDDDDEKYGDKESYAYPVTRSWWYLTYDPYSYLCTLYPQQIQGLEIGSNEYGYEYEYENETSYSSLISFSNSVPTSNPLYYSYDNFWVDPSKVTFPEGVEEPYFSGPAYGQSYPSSPSSSSSSSSLDECLSSCHRSSNNYNEYEDSGSNKCSGVIYRPHDGQCATINVDQMWAVYNPTGDDDDDDADTYATYLQSWQVFVKTRDLSPFLQGYTTAKDIFSYSCLNQPVYETILSATNQANPLVGQGHLDRFEQRVENSSLWLAPHDSNFGGSPQPKLAQEDVEKQEEEEKTSKSNAKRKRSIFSSSTALQKVDKRQSARIVRDIPIIWNAKESLLQETFETALSAAQLFLLVLGAYGDFKTIAWIFVGTAITVCYTSGTCKAPPSTDLSCLESCLILENVPADAAVRFLKTVEQVAERSRRRASKSRIPGCSSSKTKIRSKLNSNCTTRGRGLVRAPINTCQCSGTSGSWKYAPYPQGGTGILKLPDVANPALQKSCDKTGVGTTCKICCAAGYQPKIEPECVCKSGKGVWNPELGRCQPLLKCVSGTKTWSSNAAGVPGGPSHGGPGSGGVGVTPVGGSQEVLRIPVKDCKGNIYYGVGFQKSRKIPLYSMYKFVYDSAKVFTGSRKNFKFVPFPCSDTTYDLIDHQLDDIWYGPPQSNKGVLAKMDRGHLTPDADMRSTRDSAWATYYYINAAPQDSYSNQGPWQALEKKLRDLMQSPLAGGNGPNPPARGGWVMTGTCYDDTTTAGPIPDCFWKIVCLKNDNLQVTVGAFFSENSFVDLKDTAARDKRSKEIMLLRNQQDLVPPHSSALGPVTLDDLWDEFITFYPKNKQDLDECKNAVNINFPPLRMKNNPDPKYALYNWWMENGKFDDFDPNPPEEQPSTVISALGTPPPCPKRVVGYVTSWSNVPFTQTAASYLTHAVMAYVQIDADGSLLIGSTDSTTLDLEEQKSYKRLYELQSAKKTSAGSLQTMFSVGGWSNSQHFSSVMASDSLTRNFVSSALACLDYFDMDGIDLAFMYPVHGGAEEGTPEDRENYVKFLKTLRSRLEDHAKKNGRKHPYLLTIAGAAGSWILKPGFDLPDITEVVDWINVMAYDYFGAWESEWGAYTGPIAPLHYGAPPDYSKKLNVHSTMKEYFCDCANPDKIVMGMGFYGRFWNDSGSPVDGSNPLWRKAEPNDEGNFDGGFLPYRDISADYLYNNEYTKAFDQATKTPFLYQSPTDGFFLAYEDTMSISLKTKYAASKGFAGVMLWAVDLDDDEHTLLRTASSSVLCQPAQSKPYKCKHA